ncbi:MAG: CPBP family intramembrane metalloprotease [Euryarchaeota archaeon]|nr:CPBP family intramembrane metalloprotease [Euryarchaeota archaeon]
MPFDQRDDAQPGPIDWDEFHPTGPYDTYVRRTPPRRKWSLLLGIVLYFTAQYGVALILPPLLIQAGVISSRDALRLTSGGFTSWTFWILIVANVVAIVLIVAAVLWFYKEPLSSLGLTREKVPRALLFGVAGFVVAFVAATVVSIPIEQLVGVDPTQQALSQTAMEPGLLPVLFLSAVLIAPIAEEIVFRGYLYKAFRDRVKPGYAILLSSALFSFIHLEWRAFIPLFVIGIVLAYVYEKTGNLIAPITVHMLNNAVAFLWTP